MHQPTGIDTNRPAVSGWGALMKVLTDPTATFEALGAKPPILPGYLVAMLVMAVITAITLPISLKLTEGIMLQQGLPEQAMVVARWTGIIVGMITGIGTPWIAGVLVALGAMFFGQFLGGEVKFGAYLGMIGYARLPLAIGALIQGLLTLSATSLQEMAAKSISLAVFLPADVNAYLRAAVATINPFDIWYYLLLAIGFATIHKAKPSRSLALVLSVYIVTLLLSLSGVSAVQNMPAV